MKTKLLLFLFSFTFALSIQAQKELQKKYDRATFTVVPFITYLKDTIKKDTLFSSWSKLPKKSILNSEINQNLIQSDFLVSDKFYYNHTNVASIKNLLLAKQDSTLFYNLYSTTQPAKVTENSSTLFKANPDSREEIKEFDASADDYSEWIKKQVENSSIPGEMLFTWTNSEILRGRALGNLIPSEKEKIDANNYEYYKKLLEKNYIVVQHTVHTTKFGKKTPETNNKKTPTKIQETKSLVGNLKGISNLAKNFSDSKNTEDASKKAEKLVSNKLSGVSQNVEIEDHKFTKAYVFKVVLDDNTLAQLSEFPPKQPQNVKLEFIGRVFSNDKRFSDITETEANKYGNAQSTKLEFGSLEKNRKKDYYLRSKKETLILFETGEFLCAKKAFEQLKNIDNSESALLDSLINVCDFELKKSPKINQVSFKNASRIQQNQVNDFVYQTACANYEYAAHSKNFNDTQGAFNFLIETLEMNINDFKVLTTIEEVQKGNRLTSKIDVSQGIYLDQQYKILERSVNKKGEKYDRTVGTAKIIKVSKNINEKLNDSTFNLTTLAQVDGGRISEGMFLVQNDNKGKSINVGVGYRYNHGAIILGYERRIGKLIKRPMPFSGLMVGLNFVVNTALVYRSETSGWYIPKFVDLVFSRELYFHKKFDIKPYVGIGYGGDTKKGAVDRSILATVGVGLPVNLNGRFSTKRKIKLMPDLSYTVGFKPQISLQTKIDF